jgi:hypothetical protein
VARGINRYVSGQNQQLNSRVGMCRAKGHAAPEARMAFGRFAWHGGKCLLDVDCRRWFRLAESQSL